MDRIVPGFPREQIGEIREEIGYDDNLVVKAELYHLWAIGGPGYKEVMKELPLDKAGLHVVFMPSIKQFRDKKVRILNGALRNNHAYSLLVQTQEGAGLRGSRIEGVPPTVSSLLGSDGDSTTNRLQRRIVGRALLPLEREVHGLVSLDLEIE